MSFADPIAVTHTPLASIEELAGTDWEICVEAEMVTFTFLVVVLGREGAVVFVFELFVLLDFGSRMTIASKFRFEPESLSIFPKAVVKLAGLRKAELAPPEAPLNREDAPLPAPAPRSAPGDPEPVGPPLPEAGVQPDALAGRTEIEDAFTAFAELVPVTLRQSPTAMDDTLSFWTWV